MFLYTKENVLSSEFCEKLIQNFEESDLPSPGKITGIDPVTLESTGPVENPKIKSSIDISFTPEMEKDEIWGPLLQTLVPIIETEKYNYILRHELSLTNIKDFYLSSVFNMQKYEPGGAYHGFHCERGDMSNADRVLVWMIYLNDITDRGETHFYNQNHFETPKQGKMVIWPSDWTYLHRGIPSPTQTKYILTGWYNWVVN